MNHPSLIIAQLYGTEKLFLDFCKNQLRVGGGAVDGMDLTNMLNGYCPDRRGSCDLKSTLLYLVC